ncbi:MAG TPA: beta-ketoacyl-ACP synthase II [Dehalococcoidia bacterium]|nr:beta-ketoacyl-ACP synthase II [Dehalococcoidia bacterium]
MKRRVVVTGMGAVTPIGIGVQESWQALCQGKSGIGPITRFDTTGLNNGIAGEVKGFRPQDFMSAKLIRTMDPFIQLAVAASRMALEDAGLKIDSETGDRVGVVIASAVGGLTTYERSHELVLRKEFRHISPFVAPGFICNMASGQVAMQFGARGPNLCPTTACAAGSHAIGEAFKLIQMGYADAMFAGGAEYPLGHALMASLDALKATSRRSHEPQRACRPFDRDRDGFVAGEGSGILILESLETATRRGARIYAEVAGLGLNADAYHITSTDPEGRGAARCMQMALEDAGIAPGEVDYINAHGTSTIINDLSETKAIKAVFGQRAPQIPVSSNKSMTGHAFAAAGAMEAIFSIMTLRQGIIPPTINYETPDPECDLDYVPNRARRARVRVVLSNSFGFGGTNASLVLKEFSP